MTGGGNASGTPAVLRFMNRRISVLRGTEVDLREVEYAACNGMLRTLDPHSTLLSPEAYKEINLSTTHEFDRPGVYFVTALVHSHRDGDVNATFRRIPNLAQARVAVT